MAAAVLRPAGSASTCDGGTSGSSRRTAGPVAYVGDDPDVARRKKRRKTRHRSREASSAPDDIQQLLRRAHAAARPETGAAPSGQQDGAGGERFRALMVLSGAFSSVHQPETILLAVRPATRVPGQFTRITRNKCSQKRSRRLGSNLIRTERRGNHPHLRRANTPCGPGPSE